MAEVNVNKWKYYSPEFVARRYNSLAGYYTLFELVFLLPPGIRKKAVNALDLKSGDRVLEVGCGTGRNISLLSNAAGKDGIVYGLDVSPNMIQRARDFRNNHNLSNVELICGDAENHMPDVALNGVLFSLSYAVMAHRKEVLKKSWDKLLSGGKIVIMDAQTPAGIAGKLFAPFKLVTTLFLKATVLGNPYVKAADELQEVTGMAVELKEYSLKTYFIASVTKR